MSIFQIIIEFHYFWKNDQFLALNISLIWDVAGKINDHPVSLIYLANVWYKKSCAFF